MSAVCEWNMAQLTWDDFQLLSKILGRELRHRVAGYGTVIAFHAIPGDDEAMSLRPDSSEEEATDASASIGRVGWRFAGIRTWRWIAKSAAGASSIRAASGYPPATPAWRSGRCWNGARGALEAQLRTVPYDVEAALRGWDAMGYPRMDWIRGRMAV